MTTALVVIVVAPDGDFRRSLEFALQTEGFAVESRAEIGPAIEYPGGRAASCAIIDEKAIYSWPEAAVTFATFGRPVIFLVGEKSMPPDLPFLTVLTKPFLGRPLIDAVHAVAGQAPHAWTT
ncbi:MAG: hypothetical protein NTV73_04570 [Hyphomicrobiales bacterium]|nr:hypothetical protein [Hyphomicrobiales bacterium]